MQHKITIIVENARCQIGIISARSACYHGNKHQICWNWTWNSLFSLSFINSYALFTLHYKIHKHFPFFNVGDNFTPYFSNYVPRSKSPQGQEFRTYGKLSRLLNNLSTSLPITPKLASLADAYWKWKTVYHMPYHHGFATFCAKKFWVIELPTPFPWQRPTWLTLHPPDSHSSDSWLSNGTKFVLIAWGAHELLK